MVDTQGALEATVVTLKGPVEMNWSVIGMVALVYTGYKGIENLPRLSWWTMRVGLASFLILVTARIFITVNPFPDVEFIAVGQSRDKEYERQLKDKYRHLKNLEMTGFVDQFSSLIYSPSEI